jgi:oxygen-independent coproporphyrinogen-3 oxidase
MELEVLKPDAATEVGSYFVANYPPFSAWRPAFVPDALRALDEVGSGPPPLGLYIHVPFCRKRCKFCYFRVYTDKNSADVEMYLDALTREIALYRNRPRLAGRQFEFVYFGGGTPSYLSGAQLERLVKRINRSWRWDAAREVTFECEPGTLKRGKLETIRNIGVTRLSLGVEHFDDEVLERNGRAHHATEILRAYEWARHVGFSQINVDLIAGLVGDRDATWSDTVGQTLALNPDSVTIYQMELPHNTVFSHEMQSERRPHVADWATKRRWVAEAFQRFEAAGFEVSSAYTLVRARADDEAGVAAHGSRQGSFVYRDALWHGADMIGAGVASFSHVDGVHFQNFDRWEEYIAACRHGELPLARAMPMTSEQALIRELILQLKLGRVDAGYFAAKFAVDIRDRFAEAWQSLLEEGFLGPLGARSCGAGDGRDEIGLTRAGLLRVDALLPRFFEPEFRGARYT